MLTKLALLCRVRLGSCCCHVGLDGDGVSVFFFLGTVSKLGKNIKCLACVQHYFKTPWGVVFYKISRGQCSPWRGIYKTINKTRDIFRAHISLSDDKVEAQMTCPKSHSYSRTGYSVYSLDHETLKEWHTRCRALGATGG